MEQGRNLLLEEVFVGDKFKRTLNGETYVVREVDRTRDQVTLANGNGNVLRNSERLLRLNWRRVPGPNIVRCTPDNLSPDDIIIYTNQSTATSRTVTRVTGIDHDVEKVYTEDGGKESWLAFNQLELWVKEESARHFPSALIGRQWISDRDQTIARIFNIANNEVEVYMDDEASLRANYPSPAFDYEFNQLYTKMATWSVDKFFSLWRPVA